MIENLHFMSISSIEAYMLKKPFSKEEEKKVVWIFDNFENPSTFKIYFDI